MIKCVECKYYSSNPYLRCAVNPTALGGCDMGEVGEPLTQLNTDFSTQESYSLYVDWHNGERININELTGIDRDLVLMGVPVADLESSKECVNTLTKTGISYQGAIKMFHFIKFPTTNSQDAQRALNNLGRLP